MKVSKSALWLGGLLIASLAFNLAMFVRFVFTPATLAPSPRPETFRKALPLNLESRQRKEIRSIMSRFKLDHLKQKQQILAKRIEIIEALESPESTLDQLHNLTRELNTFENKANLRFIDLLFEISLNMNSPQRTQFILSLSRNWYLLKNPSAFEKHREVTHEE